MTTITVRRVEEVVPEKTISGIHSSTTPDPTLMPEEIDPHLSSPMSSYNATWNQEEALLVLQHPNSYPTRMKVGPSTYKMNHF
jgi:hypothetical protein